MNATEQVCLDAVHAPVEDRRIARSLLSDLNAASIKGPVAMYIDHIVVASD